MRRRRTLRREITVEGLGLHTGSKVKLRLRPDNGGLRFITPEGSITPSPYKVSSTKLGVTISDGNVSVRTVEHLLSALAITGVTDCLIELELGTEIPILDGSVRPWLDLINEAGFQDLGELSCPKLASLGVRVGPHEPSRYWLHHSRGQEPTYRVVSFEPWDLDELVLIYEIYWKGIWQRAQMRLPSSYTLMLIPASSSTYGHLEDVQRIRALKLSRGASLDNVLLRTFKGYTRPLKLRNELASHKLMDLIGDLYLLRFLPRGLVYALNAGHDLHVKLAAEIGKLVKEGCV